MGKKRAVQELSVHETVSNEVYKDIVRVFWGNRGGHAVNSIVKVSANGKGPLLFAIRGLNAEDKNKIFIDWLGRQRFGIEIGANYIFTIEETNFYEKVKWACVASDPSSRIAAWIAVWSGLVGIIGLVLALIGVAPIVKEWTAEKPVTHVEPVKSPLNHLLPR